jgi:hypothetical protein
MAEVVLQNIVVWGGGTCEVSGGVAVFVKWRESRSKEALETCRLLHLSCLLGLLGSSKVILNCVSNVRFAVLKLFLKLAKVRYMVTKACDQRAADCIRR